MGDRLSTNRRRRGGASMRKVSARGFEAVFGLLIVEKRLFAPRGGELI
jgi:hypothetical protein